MIPRFAIAVPIGAWHPLLHDALASLAIQEPRPDVAVLDASGDPRVAAVIDQFADRIAYRRAGPDAGQSDAILEGWAHVEGDVLGWLNADDALYPGALAAAAAHLDAHADTDVFYGQSVVIDDFGVTRGFHWAVEPPSARLLRAGIISQPSCFFRRDAYDRVGGLDRALHYTMDWDLWVRLWRGGARFRATDAVMSRVLWSREAKTGGFGPARRRELERLIRGADRVLPRLKSRVGFALHHGLEYQAPKAVAQAVRRRLAARSPRIHGMDRAGGVRDEAVLPLVHFGSGPARAVELRLQGRRVRATVTTGGTVRAVAREGVVRMDLPEPVAPGDVATLTLRNVGDRPFHFVGARLLGAPGAGL